MVKGLRSLYVSQELVSEPWIVTCHMGSHSVTCHQIQVNTTTPAREAGARFTYPGWMDGWVDLGGFVTYRDGLPVHRQSPIQVLTSCYHSTTFSVFSLSHFYQRCTLHWRTVAWLLSGDVRDTEAWSSLFILARASAVGIWQRSDGYETRILRSRLQTCGRLLATTVSFHSCCSLSCCSGCALAPEQCLVAVGPWRVHSVRYANKL